MTYDGGRIWCPRCDEERPGTEFVVILPRIESRDYPPVRMKKHRRCKGVTLVPVEKETV